VEQIVDHAAVVVEIVGRTFLLRGQIVVMARIIVSAALRCVGLRTRLGEHALMSQMSRRDEGIRRPLGPQWSGRCGIPLPFPRPCAPASPPAPPTFTYWSYCHYHYDCYYCDYWYC